MNDNNNNQNKFISNNLTQINSNQNNNTNNDNYNPYKDYLPENRIKKDNGGISPKIAKLGLIPFYVLVLAFIVIGVFWFNGNNLLKTEKRIYNMNLAESINLDTIYSSENVEWVANNDNVTIKNNTVTAQKSGSAYIYAKEGNRQVSDVKLNILTGKESINLNNHSISATVGEKTSVTVTRNINDIVDDYEKSPKEILVDFFKNIYYKIMSITDQNIVDETNEFDNSNNGENNNINPNSDNSQNQNPATTNNSEEDYEDITDDDDGGDEYYEEVDQFDDYEDLEFKSSDENIAKVNEYGDIEAISPGVVEITVTDTSGNEDHTIITVNEDDINLYNKEYTIYKGEKAIIGYSLSSNTHNNSDIKWSSDNPNIATVDSTGEVTALEVGNTNINLSVGDIKKNVSITVKDNIILPSDIKMSTASIEIIVGENKMINATVVPESANEKSLSWSSDNPYIATVSNGNIVGKGSGTTKITATTINGIKKEIIVNVRAKVLPPESIEILNDNLNMSVGNTRKIEYNIKPINATDDNIKIIYDKNYISVDENKNITALKSGTTTLTITTSNDKSATMKINIEEIKEKNILIQNIKINEGNINLNVGESKNLTVTISPNDATNKSVTWKSSNTNVITIDAKGIVKAIGAGTTQITATSVSNPNITSTITITSNKVNTTKPVTGIKINEGNINLNVGESKNLTVTISPNDATNKNITWKSSNTNVITIDAKGIVKAIGAGTTKITVTSSSNSKISSTINVTVKKATSNKTTSNKATKPVTSVTLNKTSATIYIKEKVNLTATVNKDATNKNITWSSSNTEIATVTNGKVVAKKNGTVTITAEAANNKKATATITIHKHNILITGNSKTHRSNQNVRVGMLFVNMAKNGGYITSNKLTTKVSKDGYVGQNSEVTIVTKGGSTLQYKIENEPFSNYIKGSNYDIVIMQENTARAQSKDITNYKNGVNKIKNNLKNSSAKLYLRETWPLKDKNFSTNLKQMNNNVNSLAKEIGLTAIYDGNSFKSALDSKIEVYNLKSEGAKTNDIRHQSPKGAYLAAACMYATVFKADPKKLTYNAGLDEDIAKSLKQIAHNNCK